MRNTTTEISTVVVIITLVYQIERGRSEMRPPTEDNYEERCGVTWRKI